MTALTATYLMQKFQITLEVWVKVPPNAASIGGTSANLEEYMLIKLKDLFYALMLPSGNDASLAIASFLGSYCKKSKKQKL